MKRLVITLLLLLMASPLYATTKLRLHNAPSSISGYSAMDLSLGPFGSAVQTSVTNTTASGTSIQATKTGGGTVLKWISEPIHAGFTLSGTVTCEMYGGEASAANNATVQCQLYKYSSGSEGASIFSANFGSELTTTLTTGHNWTGTPTSTAFSAGDRIVAKIFIINFGTMGAGTPGVTMHYDGATAAADGETYIQINENVTTDADGSGHCLILGITSDQVSWTVTDDKSNTWNLGALKDDAINSERISIWYATNVTAGTRLITASPASNSQWVSLALQEVNNCALSSTLDVSTGNTANSTTVTAGSVTPNYSGDYVYHYSWNTYTIQTASFTAGSQSNITWKLGFADRLDGSVSQYGVYSSNAALNPTFGTQGTAGFDSVAMFLRAGSSGTIGRVQEAKIENRSFASIATTTAGSTVNIRLPDASTTTDPGSSIRIDFIYHVAGRPTGSSNANPRTEQFPCDGNLMVGTFVAGTAGDVSGITDSNNGSWTATGAYSEANPPNESGTHSFYVGNATTTNSQTVTATFSNLQDYNIMYYCVLNAATSPFDKTATATGQQLAAGNLTTVTITPATSDGLIFVDLGVSQNTVNGLTGANQLFDSCWWSDENLSDSGCDQNNGWGHFYNPTASSSTFTWTAVDGATAISWWAARADAFKAPAVGGIVTTPMMLMGLGK